jgi:antagonist of KipI
MPIAAQLRPGDKVRFAAISLEEAQFLLREREREIERLKVGLSFKQRKE